MILWKTLLWHFFHPAFEVRSLFMSETFKANFFIAIKQRVPALKSFKKGPFPSSSFS